MFDVAPAVDLRNTGPKAVSEARSQSSIARTGQVLAVMVRVRFMSRVGFVSSVRVRICSIMRSR